MSYDELRPAAITPLSPEQAKARRSRNVMLAVLLAALMVLVFVITLTQLKAGMFQRPM